MKALIPCTLSALVVGIAAGWMLKGDPSGGAPAAEAAKPAKPEERELASNAGPGSASAAGEADAPGTAKPRIRTPHETGKATPFGDADAHMEKMMSAMKEQQSKRSESRIATLAEKLGLDANQQAKLREYFDKRQPVTTMSKGEGGGGLKIESKVSDSPGSLDDMMKGLLSAEQAAKYEELKETERNQKVQARTLREMASLTQAVEIRDDQRQAVYDILQNEARSGAGQVGGELAIGAGVAMGGFDFIDGGVAGEAVGNVMAIQVDGSGPGGEVNHEEIMSKMEQQRQANIDAKVGRLSGVLDESQLAKYRASLEQGPVFFGP